MLGFTREDGNVILRMLLFCNIPSGFRRADDLAFGIFLRCMTGGGETIFSFAGFVFLQPGAARIFSQGDIRRAIDAASLATRVFHEDGRLFRRSHVTPEA